jgi:hypothetical protein
MAEINEVQYAQSYDKMVMVHENYAPLLVELQNQLFISKLFIEFYVEVVATEGIDKTPYENKQDTLYHDRGYLVTSKNYPTCVTFFNNRLVFASTKNNRQRVFFSKQNNMNSFATYKYFLTEQMNYISLRGQIQEDKKKIQLVEDDAAKVNGPLDSFKVDPQLFPEGTTISSLMGNIMTFSQETTRQNVFTSDIQAQINAKISAFTNYNTMSFSSGPIYS